MHKYKKLYYLCFVSLLRSSCFPTKIIHFQTLAPVIILISGRSSVLIRSLLEMRLFFTMELIDKTL